MAETGVASDTWQMDNDDKDLDLWIASSGTLLLALSMASIAVLCALLAAYLQ